MIPSPARPPPVQWSAAGAPGGITPETIVTPASIALIRESFARLQPRRDEFGRMFYVRLFAANPGLRVLFPKTIDAQARALAKMMDLAVKMLDMQEQLVPLIHYLGERHAALNVKPAHFPPFGEALLGTLEEMLQDEFTPEVRRAWRDAYAFMASHMT